MFWLLGESLGDVENPPKSDEIAKDIIEDMEADLRRLRQIMASLEKGESAESNEDADSICKVVVPMSKSRRRFGRPQDVDR